MPDMLQSLVDISREVGLFLKSEQSKIQKSEIEFKGGSHNLVSRADKEAERRFVSYLEELLPESGFIAEEGTSSKIGEHYNWIIDPLDGTTNYLYNIPCYCTSVALQKNGELILGVIYDPVHDECFSAENGKGAYLNGKQIKVSDQEDLKLALVATGFPYENMGRQKSYLEILGNVNANSRGIRRLGSAALDMAYVACGRFEAFYEYGLHQWDCAAGALIIAEAGGKVTNFKGGPEFLKTRTMVSSNGKLHSGMLDLVKNWEY